MNILGAREMDRLERPAKQAQAPAPPPPSGAPPALDPRRRRLLTLCLLAWTVAWGVQRLGSATVYINNEAREGVYVRAMLDTGNWVLPLVPDHVENGEIIPDKPPLLHWIAASVAYVRTAVATRSWPSGTEVSRHFDAWSLRFPSMLAGVLMVMGLAVPGRRLLGDRGALLAGASLALSLQYVQQSQYGRVDMTMAAWVTLSMLLLGTALIDGSRRALIGSGACAALAVLGKGPVGVALPALAGTAWILIESVRRRSLRWALALPWLAALLVFVAIALPWYAAAYAQAGQAFLRSQLLHENLHQYIGVNSVMDWSYYADTWLRASFPWNLFGVLGILVAWRARHTGALFCATWWLVFLVFFQLSAYKRAAYLLPALPAGNLLCGFYLDRRLPRDVSELRALLDRLRERGWKPVVATALAALALGALIAKQPEVTAAFGCELHRAEGAAIGLGLLLACGSIALALGALRARRYWSALALLALAEVGALHGVLGTGSIALSRRDGPQLLLTRLLEDLPPEATVTLRGFPNDQALPVLYAFPDPDRIAVTPTRTPWPERFAPGYYLFMEAEWEALLRELTPPPGAWRVVWSDQLHQRNDLAPVVLAERLSEEAMPSPQ